jgi:flagellar assembly protein FliH
MIIKKQTQQQQNKKETAEKIKAAEVANEKEEKIDLFDLDNIDFSQRQERRRGDRRRGYRRIDDRNLISRAQEEAGTIKETSSKEGYQAGLEEAQADIKNFKESMLEFLKAKQEVFEYIAPDILEISVDIARKIVKREIEQNPQLVLDSILDVLKGISRDESRISIKVNPDQVSLVKESIPEIISSTGLDIKIGVFGEESIQTGSCIVYTNNGIVDATIETQLEIIKEAFKGI